MTKKWSVVLACVVVAGVALWLSFFRTSDEEHIRARLRELADIVAVKEGDTLLSRTARLRGRLKDVAFDDVRVNINELGIDTRGRSTLEENAAKAGLMFQRAECDFSNVVIKIDPDKTLATVDAVALVSATRGGERKVDRRDVHFLLRNDGGWKLSAVDVASPTRD